jgi:hypothetical protein
MSKRRIPRYLRDAEGRETPKPGGRIVADPSKQAPHNSYSGGPLFYEDKPFICADCGKEEIWTAKQQQWWYEVAKGPIHSRAIRCRECRQARRAKSKDGSPAGNQPIRSVGQLMKLVRAQIEPAVLAAGFAFAARNKVRRQRAWIDYTRPGQLFSFAFERPPRLVAELLEENGDCQTVALIEFHSPATTAEITATIKAFTFQVTEFMANLGPPSKDR